MSSYDTVNIRIRRTTYNGLKAARELFDRRVEKRTKSWGEYFTRQIRDDYGTLTALCQVEDRPDTLKSTTPSIETGLGTLYLTFSYNKNRCYEVFGYIGHNDPCIRAELEAICRLISFTLRLGAALDVTATQLRNIKCNHVLLKAPENGGTVYSLADGVAQLCGSEFKRHAKET